MAIKLSYEEAVKIKKLMDEGDSMSPQEFQKLSMEVFPLLFERITEVADTEKAAAVRLAHERGEIEKKLTKAEKATLTAEQEADETKMPEGTLAVFTKGSAPIQVLVLSDAPESLVDQLVNTASEFLAAASEGINPPLAKAQSLGGFLDFPVWGSAGVMRVGDGGHLLAKAAPSEAPADKSLTDWVRSGRAGAGPRVTLN